MVTILVRIVIGFVCTVVLLQLVGAVLICMSWGDGDDSKPGPRT